MAPLKLKNSTAILPRATITTRSRAALTSHIRSKRKADASPIKEKSLKRSAFEDLSNVHHSNVQSTDENKVAKAVVKQPIKKAIVQTKFLPSIKTVKTKQKENAVPAAPIVQGISTRAASKQSIVNQTALKSKESQREGTTSSRPKTRLSNEFDKTEESLYSSALEEINDSIHSSSSKTKLEKPSSSISKKDESPQKTNVTLVAEELEVKLNLGNHEVPENIHDFDKENWDDTFQVSHYAMDIFTYLKSREDYFDIPDYMDRQVCLTPWMRSLLIDWMVEVQESFELNHETLYLGIKLVDIYLNKIVVGKETLQLVGAAAMFVAAKFDERIPPLIDDFLYICDGAYSRRELVRMEINLLKVCDFDLGIPISYRFLRRYARCAKISMPVLTLARFILEYSLMDYATVTVRDSILAASALFLALQMKEISGWTETLEFYSGYKLPEMKNAVCLLNNGLHKKTKSPLMTVRNKYSHKIFFEVAKTPLISNENLKF